MREKAEKKEKVVADLRESDFPGVSGDFIGGCKMAHGHDMH